MYLTLDTYINEKYRLAVGVRSENGEQMVNTYDVFQPVDLDIEKVLDEDYMLPSFTLTYLPEFIVSIALLLVIISMPLIGTPATPETSILI